MFEEYAPIRGTSEVDASHGHATGSPEAERVGKVPNEAKTTETPATVALALHTFSTKDHTAVPPEDEQAVDEEQRAS